MATLLGYCKKCQVHGDDPRFIEVNPTHDVIICPRCGTRMTPKQACANYDNFFEKLYKEAEILLFRARNYSGAYKAYAKIIDYRPEDVTARYGRILSLIYLSSLRTTYFDESLLMFSEEKKKYLRQQKYRSQYFVFIKEANKAVDKYRTSFKKRLIYKSMDAKEYFYDEECVSLFFHRILQIKNFKEMFLQECNFLKNKLEDESFSPLIDLLTSEIKQLEKELKQKRIDINGNIYTFNKISENDQAIIAHGDVKAVKLPANIKTHTLVDKKAKGEVVIKDNIYTGARFFYIVSKIAIPVFFGCAASSIVLFILSASIKSASTLFRVIASIVLSFGALAILVHGVWEIACRLSDNYLLLKPKPIIRRRKK